MKAAQSGIGPASALFLVCLIAAVSATSCGGGSSSNEPPPLNTLQAQSPPPNNPTISAKAKQIEATKQPPARPPSPEPRGEEEYSPAAEGSFPEGVKAITELSPEELDVANGICQRALKDFLGNRPVVWYLTTFHYLPTSDEDIGAGFSGRKKLRVPITLVSASVMSAYDLRGVRSQLKDKVYRLEASHGGKRYRIDDCLVDINPGAGGGSFGASNDMVTIIPTRLAVY